MKTINKELLEELLDCDKIFKTEDKKINSILYFMNNNNYEVFELDDEEEISINKIIKRNGGECQRCGKLFLNKHLFSYVDENNIAITKNSPDLCVSCYKSN